MVSITGLIDALVHGASAYHTLGGLGLSLGTAWIAWRLRPRPGFVLMCVAGFGLWTLLQYPPDPLVAGTYLPAALLLWAPAYRRWNAPLVAAIASLTVFLIKPLTPSGYLVAALVAGAASLARPRQPTLETLRALRTLALYLPAVALAGVLAWNSATRFGQRFEPLDALLFGLALAGVFSLLSLGALGLATLLETSEAYQLLAWNSSSAILGVLAGYAMAVKDPSEILASLYVAAPTTALLGAIVIERFRGGARQRATPSQAAPPIPVTGRKIDEASTPRSARRWP